MNFIKEKGRECARLQKWITENKTDWLTICGVERKIDKNEYLRLLDVVIENQFEQIFLVLITIHNYALNEEYGDFRMVVIDMLIDVCKNRGIELSEYPTIHEITEKLGLEE